MVSQLGAALLSPEVLPWLTGSGGALVVLAFWVQAERSDKRELRKECASWRATDAVRSDTVTALVRECTACITQITAQVSNGSDQISDIVEQLRTKVENFRCNATPTFPADERKPDARPIPGGLPKSV